MCVGEMHHIDRMGGAEDEAEVNRRRLDYDNRRLMKGEEPPGATHPASGRPPRSSAPPQGMMPHDQPMGGDGGREHRTEPGGSAVPGAERGPAPAQLNNQPTQPHQP